MFEDIIHAELQRFLDQSHVIVQIGEGHFGLDHPEFGSVTGGVALLGAEGRAEGIDIAVSQGKRLDVKLARNGQRGLAAIEIGLGRFSLVVQGSDGKGLPRTFGIIRGDFGSVDVDESFALEEFVNGKSQDRTDAVKGKEGVRPRTKMGNLTKVFKRVAFLLKRVVEFDSAKKNDFAGPHFEGLFHLGGQDDASFDLDRSAGQKMGSHLVVRKLVVIDDLDILETSPIVQGQKADGARIAVGTDPSLQDDLAECGEVFAFGEGGVEINDFGRWNLHSNVNIPFFEKEATTTRSVVDRFPSWGRPRGKAGRNSFVCRGVRQPWRSWPRYRSCTIGEG